MLAVLDYGMGNLRSLRNAFDYLGIDVEVVSDPSRIPEFSHVVLPGVGAFGKARENLDAQGFVAELLAHAAAGKPLLGICLGMQLLASSSEEFGHHPGLSLIPGKVVHFEPSDAFPVPHVGWNGCRVVREHPILKRAKKSVDYYYVHSLHFVPDEGADLIASADYGHDFAAVVGRGSVIGCQFHPEKSQAGGLALLEAFASWDGRP